MAYFGVTATDAGLAPASDGEGLDQGLRRRLAGVTPGAPIVVMVHGYNYDPARTAADRTASLFAFVPSRDCRRIRSWPTGLGFAEDGKEFGPGDRLRLAGDGATPSEPAQAAPDRLRHRLRPGGGGRRASGGARAQRPAAGAGPPGRHPRAFARRAGGAGGAAAPRGGPAGDPARGCRVRRAGAGKSRGRALALAARCLQRHGAGQRPVRLCLRDVRAAPRVGGTGRRPRARRRAAALARPGATGRQHRPGSTSAASG